MNKDITSRDVIEGKATTEEYVTSRVIDLTPTWEGVVPIYIDVLLNPKAGEKAINASRTEIERMAKLADLYVKAAQPAERYQIAEWHAEPSPEGDTGRWLFIAHGARYTADEAASMQARIEARGGRVMLLPC